MIQIDIAAFDLWTNPVLVKNSSLNQSLFEKFRFYEQELLNNEKIMVIEFFDLLCEVI